MTKRLYILLFILTPLINYAQVIDCDETIIPFTTVNNVSCFNESDGSIEVIFNSIFGGTPPYSVIWEQLIDTDGNGIDDSQNNNY